MQDDESTPSPYAPASELEDSPYGTPVDLGAVGGESEMQLPWLSASPEQEDMGELGLLTIDWNISGRSIIHVRLEDKSRGDFYNRQVLTPGLARYQNSANLMMEAQYGGLTSALDLDVDWIGYSNTELSDVGQFSWSTSRWFFGFELNALYLIWDDILGIPWYWLQVWSTAYPVGSCRPIQSDQYVKPQRPSGCPTLWSASLEFDGCHGYIPF